jgi:hypothetical protein
MLPFRDSEPNPCEPVARRLLSEPPTRRRLFGTSRDLADPAPETAWSAKHKILCLAKRRLGPAVRECQGFFRSENAIFFP